MRLAEQLQVFHFDKETRSGNTAIEANFPIVEVSLVAERESWRKELNRPLSHIHKWWATRLGSVFRAVTFAALSPARTEVWQEFYRTQNLNGKVVLDPFMGSGTTVAEALKLGCKAIGCDINPVSTFLVRQSLTRVSEAKLREVFSTLEREAAPEIKRYFQTVDPSTGCPIPVLYFFWVKVVITPDGEPVPLFSSYIFSKDAYPKKKPKAQIVCPNCWEVMEGRYDSTHMQCPRCMSAFNPQKGTASGQYVTTREGRRYKIKDLLPKDGCPPTHRMYAMLALRPTGEKVYLPVTDKDEALYNEAERRLMTEDLPLPTIAVRQGYNTDQARGYNYLYWRDFFNARQLLCLGLLLRSILRIENQAVKEQFICLFSSVLEFNNMFCSFKGEGTGAVRHMFSHHIIKPERTPLENSVWGTDKSSGTFVSLFESRLLRAKRYLDDPFEVAVDADLIGGRGESSKVTASEPIDVFLADSWDEFSEKERCALILNGDSGRLPVPDRVVDAVITDPPYFDFVHYSELSDFFFAWLSPILRDRYMFFGSSDSAHPGEVQHKDPQAFARQLTHVFSECARVLKDDGVLAFSFHHSRSDGWAAIYEAIIKAGFEVAAAHPVHAELRVASPKTAAKEPISLDAVLVCRKRVTASQQHFYIDINEVVRRTHQLADTLENAQMRLSSSDRYVIAASQLLVELSGKALSLEEVSNILDEVAGVMNNTINCAIRP